MLDGLFEFFPQSLHKVTKKIHPKIMNKKFKGEVFDINGYIKNKELKIIKDININKQEKNIWN